MKTTTTGYQQLRRFAAMHELTTDEVAQALTLLMNGNPILHEACVNLALDIRHSNDLPSEDTWDGPINLDDIPF